MPYKEKEIAKIYWSIAEVAKLVHRDTSTVRFWERELYWIKVKKNKRGERQYTKKEVNQILQVNQAVSFVEMKLSGVEKAYSMGYLDKLIKCAIEFQKEYAEEQSN